MAPVNDLIANAVDITTSLGPTPTLASPGTPVAGTTVAATYAEDASITTHRAPVVGPSVWYKWQLAVDTTVVFSSVALGGDFDVATGNKFLGGEVYTGSSSATTAGLTTTRRVLQWGSAGGSSTPQVGPRVAVYVRCFAGQWYYLRVGNAAGSTTFAGSFSFLFTKAPPLPPTGTAWKPSQIISLGAYSDAFAIDTANTSTITKTLNVTQTNAANPSPGWAVTPDQLGLWTEPKLVGSSYLVALVAYDDPAGSALNSVSSITQSSGAVSWSQIAKLVAGGSGADYELWLGKITAELDPGTTWTITLASATTIKGAVLWGFHGLHPTSPIAGHSISTTTGFSGISYNFDMGALLTTEKGLLLAMHAINWNGAAFAPSQTDLINSTMPGFVAQDGAMPGLAWNLLFGNVTASKSKTALFVADFRQSPHPANAASGVRDIGFGLTAPPSASCGFAVLGVMLRGAPQS